MKASQWIGLVYIVIAVVFIAWKREAMFTFTNDFTFYSRWLISLAMVALGVRRLRQ